MSAAHFKTVESLEISINLKGQFRLVSKEYGLSIFCVGYFMQIFPRVYGKHAKHKSWI